MKIIAVFGSASPRPGDADYALAYDVGRRLAQAGFAVQTGGYIGMMEATSRGASEAGGHVIGITSAQIEAFRPGTVNRWVNQDIRYDSLRERIMHLVIQNDGMLALPGGIGTLAEIALAWSLMQVGEVAPRPLITIGALWRATMAAFVNPAYVKAQHAQLLHTVDTVDEALALLGA